MWLTTGRRPDAIVRLDREVATFPAFPPEQKGRVELDPLTSLTTPAILADCERVQQMFMRLQNREWMGIESTDFDESTSVSLRAALYLLDASTLSVEAGQVLGQAYGLIQGLLTSPTDEDTLASARAAALLGSTVGSRRRIRRAVAAIREIRNAAAHGRRPTWSQAAAAAGARAQNQPDQYAVMQVEREMIRRARELMQMCFGAVLWLAAQPSADLGMACTPAMTKARLLTCLDQIGRSAEDAVRRSASLRLNQLLPGWLRDPFGTF